MLRELAAGFDEFGGVLEWKMSTGLKKMKNVFSGVHTVTIVSEAPANPPASSFVAIFGFSLDVMLVEVTNVAMTWKPRSDLKIQELRSRGAKYYLYAIHELMRDSRT